MSAESPGEPMAGPVLPPSGPPWLSHRELQVLALVAEGRSNRQIGTALGLSPLTIKAHLYRIGKKLDSGDRAHMVALAMRAGVIV
ncbi:response regulator transcription factor [Actinomycetospora flava]|uniref:response regulator transcription factor n=1 Tax=Actinomycetospora flava TaxID=3129232 RepID=UPI0035A125D1